MDAKVERMEGTAAEAGSARWLPWLGMGLAVAFVALLLAGLYLKNADRPQGRPAPDFVLETFDGQVIRLSEQRGKVVVINIWASWCVSCREEAPILERVWRAYKDTGQVLFLGVDYVDTRTAALAYIAEFDITYPNGPDKGEKIYEAYRAQGVPETFIVDKKGIVRHIHVGPISESILRAQIEALLKED